MREYGSCVCVTDPKWYMDLNADPVKRASVDDMIHGVVIPKFDAPKEVHNAFLRIVTDRMMNDNFVMFYAKGCEDRGDDVYAGWVTPGMTLGSLSILLAMTFVVATCVVLLIWG